MCGRFSLEVDQEYVMEVLKKEYEVKNVDELELRPNHNISPGQDILAIIHDGKQNRAGFLKWGFVPPFAKDEKIGYKMINARSETVDQKPSFRSSFVSKRCVIVADGFYEWKNVNGNKEPYKFKVKEEELIAFAGLWSGWKKPDGKMLYTCTILTTKANEVMKDIHDRMPVILDKREVDIWLNINTSDKDTLLPMLKPLPEDKLYYYPVERDLKQQKSPN